MNTKVHLLKLYEFLNLSILIELLNFFVCIALLSKLFQTGMILGDVIDYIPII